MLPATPDFATFAELKRQLLVSSRVCLDLSETRLAKQLAHLRCDPEKLDLPAEGYRCHVAENWLECFGLPAEWKRRALVTQGVRHSLQALLGGWAAQGKRVLLPQDVYPVYLELAQAAGCAFATYESYPEASFEGLDQVNVLVVASPFKPRGSTLTAGEMARIRSWLAADITRRVVLDAVYTMDTRLSTDVLALYATGQAIVLHSLSKGWASPLLAGIALLPEADVEAWTPTVRALVVPKPGLRIAQGLLAHDKFRSELLSAHLWQREQDLRETLREFELAPEQDEDQAIPGQYLFTVKRPWTELLSAYGVLAMPLSAFGSARADVSVVSSLPPLRG